MSIYYLVTFQFPNGFSQKEREKIAVSTDIIFQFPNGFSLKYGTHYKHYLLNIFQFPNGFSRCSI